ncbi:alpha-glucan family phosphorylase [Mucilaginibacter paludis]|uniref:Alpha-glucan phosphorylase n=1 Tax=Mucilaginibacter paludis DSM 18603 TaxID=714943 RepID=H1YBC2_9SPHI|nr:alpha-glucan family phosphorylase [Mucilaginibacter paludis]EHQ31176.1 alpha-glucan phosphorylase [Mucilaginibacter paludis DSM 18603]
MLSREEIFGYEADPKYNTMVAYFSMEFAIDQALKTYSGGLGFLAGSHMRSAYQLKQNMIGISMLWTYGYYDQARDSAGFLKPAFIEKHYSFLVDTGITVIVQVHRSPVHVKAYLLKPETFGTAPVLFLTTDIPENDYLSDTITARLYDSNEATRIAQSMILGIGGAMVLDALNIEPDVYHMNEGHAVPLNFYLYQKYNSLQEVKKRVVFTTHTPEVAGNEEHRFGLLDEMSFFGQIPVPQVREMLQMNGDGFNYTLAALKFSRKANGVSKIHGEVARKMWQSNPGICDIISITNAQDKAYWKDEVLDEAITNGDDDAIVSRKKELKHNLFKIVADQCGKLFKEDVLTIVWARRITGYKRADFLMANWDRFVSLISNTQRPVQMIWAGKPYPEDKGSIDQFNYIMGKVKNMPNCAVLIGYELELSGVLKRGSDVWLNNPRMYREASGTSGMTAAMNGSINLSMPDGWVPEFAVDNQNCFLIQPAADDLPEGEKDRQENDSLLSVLENTVVPLYYDNHQQWLSILKKAAHDVVPAFEAGRQAREYYDLMYNASRVPSE